MNPITYARLPLDTTKILFTSTTESKVVQVVKAIFAYTLGLGYTFMHWLASLIICPRAHEANTNSITLAHSPSLEAKRATILADGYPVDVIVLKTKDQPSTRWNIVAGGNGEGIHSCERFQDLVEKTGGNAIYFDYRGLKNRGALVKAGRAVMKYVESEGAKQVTAIGWSLGGGVLREAYKYHLLEDKKANVDYAFIFDRTFSRVKDVPGRFLGFFAQVFGWNLGSLSVSKSMRFEIRIQGNFDEVIQKHAWLGQKGNPKAELFEQNIEHGSFIHDLHENLATKVNAFFATLKPHE